MAELRIDDVELSCGLRREGDDVGVEVDSNRQPGRASQPGELYGDVPAAAADVETGAACRNADPFEQLLGRWGHPCGEDVQTRLATTAASDGVRLGRCHDVHYDTNHREFAAIFRGHVQTG